MIKDQEAVTIDKIRFQLIRFWLTEGCGPIFAKKVLLESGFDFQSGKFCKELRAGQFFAIAQKLLNGKPFASEAQVNKQLALAEQNNIAIITIVDREYPESLRNIYAPPTVLTAIGCLQLLQEKITGGPCIKLAIVGSRKALPYAFRAIDIVLPELLSVNCHGQGQESFQCAIGSCFVTVSGGAVGVDTYVHRKTVALGGKTIVVLGSGLLNVYPSENKKLFETLVQTGSLILSSFALNGPVQKQNFPIRNRIIAGLAKGTLIVQAGVKSGALITGNFALDEGRDVFVVPGPIDQIEFEGSNKLLASGATVVCRANDILDHFGFVEKPVINPCKISDAYENFSPLEIRNYDQLEKQELPIDEVDCNDRPILQFLKQKPFELEHLAQKLSLDYNQLEEELFSLELDGQIEQRFDGLWQMKKT